MKTIRIGREMYRVSDEPGREAEVLQAVDKARKLPTAKQFRARINATKDKREFPAFHPGMSVAKYVTDYYVLNQERLNGNLFGNAGLKRSAAKELIAGFFEPLSTLPMFAQSGEVIEETLSQPA